MNDIVMVTCRHFVSGIGKYSYELAKSIRKTKNVTLFKPGKKNAYDQEFDSIEWIKPYSYRSLRKLHQFVFPLYVARHLWDVKADLFHAHWFLSGLGLCYLKKNPAVITIHDVSILHVAESKENSKNYFKWAIELFKKHGIHLIVVSENAKVDTMNYANYPEKLVHAIPNGIDVNFFKPMLSKNKSKDKFIISNTSGLGPKKGIPLLLRAFKKLESRFDFIELQITGAYPHRTIYPKLAQELEIKNIKFLGFVPDEKMNLHYNNSDLLINTSEYEGFGFAPLEAMASGVPVLSTSGGALGEIAGPGSILIDYNEDDIFEKASFIIENDLAREELIQKGLRHSSKYRWEDTASKTIDVYNGV